MGDIHAIDNAYFYARRFREALPYYERLNARSPQGRPLPAFRELAATIEFAVARRSASDEAGAEAEVEIVRRDLAARRSNGERNMHLILTEAMLAAFEGNTDRSVEALRTAIAHGLRFSLYVDGPAFDGVRDDPRFATLRQELAALAADEHDKVLQLICFHNPIQEKSRPMPETCSEVAMH